MRLLPPAAFGLKARIIVRHSARKPCGRRPKAFWGEIGGVNTTSLDAVASMDHNDIFYFISPRSYSVTASTIYSGTYSKGTVSGVALVPGVSLAKPGIVDFDNEVSADGATLYFSEGTFDAAGNPRTAKIIIARRVGSGFTRDPDSGTIMKTINTAALDYAADVSAPELEIFFTRLDPGGPAIYTATRSSTSAPFGTPGKITAIIGFAEAPSIAPDDKSLYYHVKDSSGVFVINRVSRP